MTEPLRIWTPAFSNTANTGSVAFPVRGGLFYRRLLEIPGLIEFFGRIDVTFSGSGIALFTLGYPSGVGVPTAGNAWGHLQYNNGGGGVVVMQIEATGAGVMQVLGTGTAGTRVCGITGQMYVGT